MIESKHSNINENITTISNVPTYFLQLIFQNEKGLDLRELQVVAEGWKSVRQIQCVSVQAAYGLAHFFSHILQLLKPSAPVQLLRSLPQRPRV